MKKFIAIVTIFLMCGTVLAKEYYIDADCDTPGDGTTSTCDGDSDDAWDDLSDITDLEAGDTVYLNRGDTWREEIVVPSSGSEGSPITFAAYGNSEDSAPIINAADLHQTWTQVGITDVYSSPCDWTALLCIEDDTILKYVAWDTDIDSTDDNMSAGTWTLDTTSDLIYVWATDDADPGTHTMEVTKRSTTIYSLGKNYIVVDGLTCKYGNSVTGGSISIYDGTSFTLQNSTITRSSNAGVLCYNVVGVLIQDNTSSYNGQAVGATSGCGINCFDGCEDVAILRNVTNMNEGHGVYCSYININAYATDGLTIAYNSTSDKSYGIVGEYGQGNTVIEYNTVDGVNTGGLVTSGIGVQYGIGTYSYTIRYNHVKDIDGTNDGYGILIDHDVDGAKVYYNVVYGCRAAGLGAIDADGTKFWNNTCYNNYAGIWLLKDTEGCPNTVIQNNILSENTDQNIRLSADSTVINADTNCYYSDTGRRFKIGDSNYNFSGWKTQLGGCPNSGNDCSSIASDPLFNNASEDYFLPKYSSPVINAGTDVSLTKDYDGISVPQGSGVDIGAFEFVPTFDNNSTTTTTIQSDNTPPTGTVTINHGNNVTYSLNVFLTLFAANYNNEPLGNVVIASDGKELDANVLMTFSNDSQEWSDPEPYSTAKAWTLSPGEGLKTVYVKFCDAAGNWIAEPVQDEITYEELETVCDNPQKMQPVSIAASSEFLPFFSVENAFDGNPLTKWSTVLSFFKKDEFITLDLGEIKRLRGLTMYASKLFGTNFFPTDFQIQLSRDDVIWTRINTEEGYIPSLNPPYTDSWIFENLEYRYIRVYITRANTLLFFLHMAQIAEIAVYGCDIEDYIPVMGEEYFLSEAETVKGPAREEKTTDPEPDQLPLTTPGKPIFIFK